MDTNKVKERAHRICLLLENLIFTNIKKIKSISFHEGKEIAKREPLGEFQRWGGKDKHYRFYAEFTVPDEFNGKRVDIILATGLSGNRMRGGGSNNAQFIFYLNGQIMQGMDANHSTSTICYQANAGDKYELEFEAYSGMHNELHEFYLFAAEHNDNIEKIYYHLKVPADCLMLFDQEDKKYSDIANHLTNAINLLDMRKELSPEFFEGVDRANEYMDQEFYGRYCQQTEIVANFVGHTHIDVAYLWRIAQTEEKVERSFATMLKLLDEYPDFIFSSSQPQLYKFIQTNNLGLYENIKKRVAEGRWETEGAMWLEADCNLTSGESLIRQIIHGKRFFKDEFGKESRLLWLPDVFGYSGALPQILKKSGIDYFITSKLSWNEYNKIPYDTFMWKGIDGSEVFTQFITLKDHLKTNIFASDFSTYNGSATANQILGGWTIYKSKEINSEIIAPIGYGDGGGGTTRGDIEMALRMNKGIPGIPTVKFGTILDHMDRVYNTVKDNPHLPEWVGELYFEYHRGTYTSIARNKKYNRKSEIMLQNAELFLSMSAEICGGEYPFDKLHQNWEMVLLNQFHDILPGSSIKEVYEDSMVQYEDVKKNVSEMINNTLLLTAANINTEEDCLAVFNATGYKRSDIIDYNGKKGYINNIPASGYRVIKESDIKQTNNISFEALSDGMKVSNQFFDIIFDGAYHFESLIDKRCGREVLNGRGNVLQAFEDFPLAHDAWNINIYYQEKMWEIDDVSSVETIDLGAAKAVVVTRKFLTSTIKQKILFYDDIPRIDFENEIDWKEKHILLKAAFPVAVHSEKATYDIQFGNLERPTHWNTSWDKARFEVCGHKWADLSQDDYGVSILNDCKYGYDIKGGLMRITLIKSATSPNEDADRELHSFTYSLYPHEGGWRNANVPKSGYFVNYPLFVHPVRANTNGNLPKNMSVVSVDKENAVIEAFKKAEDGNGYILRLYDCYNRTDSIKATLFKEAKEIWECDLIENGLHQINVCGNSFSFKIDPYEIKTFRIVF